MMRRSAALKECCEMEGILPAIESAHALAGTKRWAAANPGREHSGRPLGARR
jgi:tryptophan synthase beta subunit